MADAWRREKNMRLIGILYSPMVRRTAIALDALGVPFTFEIMSMFRNFEQFAAINPLVKAPTLVTGDGTVLMDSGVIIDYARTIAPDPDVLKPRDPARRLLDLRLGGLGLAAIEITLHLTYEVLLRPAEKQHSPWIDRVRGQIVDVFHMLDRELETHADQLLDGPLPLSAITIGVIGSTVNGLLARYASFGELTALAAFVERVEVAPSFRRFALDPSEGPLGDGRSLSAFIKLVSGGEGE
jgi:glutathione S-transferase